MTASDDGETAAMSASGQLGARSCVLETLLWSDASADPPGRVGLRYVMLDGFEQAIDYCQHRLLADLVAPMRPDDPTALVRWRRARARCAPHALAARWRAVRRALAALREQTARQIAQQAAESGYAPALADQLRGVVERYGLDFELGAVYLLPDDLAALLARVGDPFVWWDDASEQVERERAPFDYANPAHRAALARRVREANADGDYLDDGGGVFGATSAPADAG